MTKYTGGKWAVGGSPKSPHVFSEYGVIAILEPDIYNYDKSRIGEPKANALLIASAPEMSESLKKLIALIEGLGICLCGEKNDLEEAKELLKRLA